MTRTGVGSHFSAAHRGTDGGLHGHTWRVKAWFASGADAVLLQHDLEEVLKSFDHRLLDDALSRGEAIAEAIGSALPLCLSVEIAREPEGIYAAWSPDVHPVPMPLSSRFAA